MNKWIGKVVVSIGIIHLTFGFIAYLASWTEMVKQGLFNTVAGQSGHGVAFWFIAFGLLVLILGGLIDWCEGNNPALPVFLGWSLLGLSILGIVMMPVSGWWLLMVPAIAAIRSSRKTVDYTIR